jgi:two-component system phosphate regulon sensor histidine kinase PhoR
MKHVRTRLLTMYIGLTVLMLGAAGFLATVELDQYFHQWLTDDLSTRTDLILTSLRRRPIDHQTLVELGWISAVRITLIDPTGTVLGDSEIPDDKLPSVENHIRRPEIQQAIKSGLGIDTRHSATIGVDYLYLAKQSGDDIMVGTGRVAIVRVSYPLTKLKAMTDDIRWDITLAGLAALVVVIGVSIFMSYRISRPMVAIARDAEKIRAGDLETRIEIRSHDEIGRVAEAVNAMVDQLKKDIAQLKRLEEVRTQFLGNVSHELRTPIFAVQGFLETLLDGALEDPSVNRDFLEKAHAHAMRLNSLLNDLIDISRIESGEMRMSFRYFHLKDFLTSAVDSFEPLASSRSVHLTVGETGSPGLHVLGDRERLMQVLTNLLSNAIKYNRPDGSVTVSVREEKEKVWIDVADTGFGILQEYQARIFERFYRVDKQRSREAGGTGLGLAIVKHIIEAHGGAVSVQSEYGKGSVFSFPIKK